MAMTASALFGGELAMEWLAKRLSPDVDFEFDPGWCVVAGGDAAAWLAAHPHRNPTVHLTPAIADGSGLAPGEAGLGSPRDKVDWRTLIPLWRRTALDGRSQSR